MNQLELKHVRVTSVKSWKMSARKSQLVERLQKQIAFDTRSTENCSFSCSGKLALTFVVVCVYIVITNVSGANTLEQINSKLPRTSFQKGGQGAPFHSDEHGFNYLAKPLSVLISFAL